MKPSIFKAYDIRGIVPEELTASDAAQIAAAFASILREQSNGQPLTIALGRDNRLSSDEFAAAIIATLTAAGVTIKDIGLATTPLFYFAIGHLQCDAGLMVTASHNPPQYNGIKFADKQGLPLDPATMALIQSRIGEKASETSKPGSVDRTSVMDAYIARNRALVPDTVTEPLHIIIDTGNGVSAPMCEAYFTSESVRVSKLFFELDGRFPNREPNPLEEKNNRFLREEVIAQNAACGIAFDADGDRVIIIDERGILVPPDLLTAFLARELLSGHPGAAIVYDVRSSWSVRETIISAGGAPIVARVGHTFIKRAMHKHDALFAGELSGHYYFKEMGSYEAPLLVVQIVLNALSRTGRPLSELITEVSHYHATGEINFPVENASSVLAHLKTTFADAHLSSLDGLTIEYENWWCNVRPSNTEPLLRLNLEARDTTVRDEKLREVTALISAV